MNKAEQWAVSHFLEIYPEEWSYNKIIGELRDGNINNLITLAEKYQGYSFGYVAQIIERYREHLQKAL